MGETITLTVTGDDAGATAYFAFGRLEYNGARTDNGTRTQTTLIGQYGKWTPGVLIAGDYVPTSSFSDAFNQIITFSDTATNLPGTLSTVTLIATALGIVNVNCSTTSPGNQLFFFGLSNAPGTSFTIVPEPATAALLVLGLLTLAGWRRARD